MPEPTELGAFLRTRREQLTPADVGLPDTGRRRTPGLRREEVAALAGLSIDYLVRLEQGRDRNPSVSVVNALAGALLLDADERLHLKKLSACAGEPDACPHATGEAEQVPDTVRALLDRLDPAPAVVVGPWFQVIASNATWAAVMRPTGVFDEPSPNLVRFTFLDPRSRELFPDWAGTAGDQVAVLRDARVRWRNDPRLEELFEELLAVPDFAVRWRSHDVARRRRGTMPVAHPELGSLLVAYEVLLLPDDADQRLITWLPADAATEAAFARVTAAASTPATGHLRIVG